MKMLEKAAVVFLYELPASWAILREILSGRWFFLTGRPISRRQLIDRHGLRRYADTCISVVSR